MEARLDGRVALVTGGSKGIGLAIATRLAASGADVALLARGTEALDAACGVVGATARGRVHVVPCDVSQAEEVARAHDDVLRTLGHVDVLVNNAGTSRTGAFPAVTDAIWQEDLDLKLFAAIRLTRLVWPGMAERGWGRVINVLATVGKAPRPGTAPTAISRAAAWR